MEKIESKVNEYCSFEFDPFRKYEGHEFWSLSKRKSGRWKKGQQITLTNEEEKEVFIEMLKDIIAMVEIEGSEEDIPF